MLAFESLGHCYIKSRTYHKALLCFKKQLELTWSVPNCYSHELKAYDNIGLVYYYLNDLEKSTYYHDRYIKGYYESSRSLVRQAARLKREESNRIQDFKYDLTTCSDRNEIVINRTTSFLTSKMGMINVLFTIKPNEDVSFFTGTPLSNMSDRSLPSPHDEMNDEEMDVFPNFSLREYLKKSAERRVSITAANSKYKKQIHAYKQVR
jgi:tetratricopeptide (TPR) repeat protein